MPYDLNTHTFLMKGFKCCIKGESGYSVTWCCSGGGLKFKARQTLHVKLWLSRVSVSHVCVPANANSAHTCLAPDWVSVCLCICMPVSEWYIAPYLPVPGHMTLLRH